MSRIVAGFGAVALLAATANSPVAFAATVGGAVTSIDVVETTAAAGQSVKVVTTWSVPDGSKAGDTFTLTLPTMLVTDALNGVSRELKDDNGEVVAVYTVSGQVVTFTLTEYVEDHIDVSGTAYFGVRLARDLGSDPRTPVAFRVNGAVWPDVDYIDLTGPGPRNDYSSSATKWQTWGKVGDDPRGGILWSIVGPTVSQSLTHGGTYVIQDEPGPGQSIDCTELNVFQGEKNINGAVQNRTHVGVDRYTKSCTADSATVTIKPTARDVGKVFMLLGNSTITDPNLSEYKNSGSVTLWGTAKYLVGSVLKIEAGGDGRGTKSSPNPSATPTRTPATPTATVTVPGPTSTVTVPGPTSTVTVTSPGYSVVVVPPVVVQPGLPVPTGTATSTLTATSTAGGTPIASGVPTVTTTAPSTPVSSGAPAAPASSGTATVTRTVNAAPVAGDVHMSSGSPTRIDTGLPADEMNSALLAAGGLLTAGSLSALALAGRDALRRRRH